MSGAYQRVCYVGMSGAYQRVYVGILIVYYGMSGAYQIIYASEQGLSESVLLFFIYHTSHTSTFLTAKLVRLI